MALQILQGPFTVDTYQRLGELGVLREDERVELVAGQVVAMTPIGPAHWSCVNRLTTLFAPLAGPMATLSVQNPLILETHDAPQPDIAVLQPRADGYRAKRPGPADVLLVIEVADSSLVYDRDVKIPRYARAGIPDVWLVDLTGERIEVFRDPVAGTYADVRRAARDAVLSPLRFPNLRIPVADILG